MEELRLPWSPKEGLLFGFVITLISCTLIGGANVYLAVGPDKFIMSFLGSFVFVLAFAYLISNTYVSWISGRVVRHFMHPNDHPDTYICYNLIMCVVMMCMSMSLLGPFAGQISSFLFDGEAFDIMRIFENWRFVMPRNFFIAFWVEMLIAQPVARKVMVYIHKKKISAMNQESA